MPTTTTQEVDAQHEREALRKRLLEAIKRRESIRRAKPR
jgi:hypothetical protein